MELKVRLGKKFRQILAGLMVGILVMSQSFSGVTAVYASSKKEDALYSIDIMNLLEAIEEAEESASPETAFDFSSLDLKADKSSVLNDYEDILDKDGDDGVYLLDPEILDIDDTCTPYGTALDVFYNSYTSDLIFLYENGSDSSVTFCVNINGYETEPVVVGPNSYYLDEDDEDDTGEPELTSDITESSTVSSEDSIEKSTETTTVEETEKTEKSTEVTTAEMTESSTEETSEESTEEMMESSTEETSEESMEEMTESSTEETSEGSTEEMSEESTEETSEESTEEMTESSMEETSESSTEESTEAETKESSESAAETTQSTENLAVSVATDSDATLETDSDASGSDWQEHFKSTEEIALSKAEKEYNLAGNAYDTVTIGDCCNARAYVTSLDNLSELLNQMMNGGTSMVQLYTTSTTLTDSQKIYLGSHTAYSHSDGYVATSLEDAYTQAIENDKTEIYICSQVRLTENEEDYINNKKITFVRCEENTSDYLFNVSSGTVTMEHTQIDGNEVESTCSLIFVNKDATLEITGDTEIKNGFTRGNDQTNGNGGAILVYDGTLLMTGGTITENKVFDNETTINKNDYRNGCGGAIYIYSDDQGEAQAEFDGGIISNNYAGKYGGAICAQYATVNFGTNNGESTEVTENVAYLSGSGICYGTESSGKIYQAEFTGNSTDSYYTTQVSGAISIVKGAYVEMKNVYVTNNSAEYDYSHNGALYSCPTSKLAIFEDEGALIVDNKNVGDISYDRKDDSAADQAFVSNTALGGGEIKFYSYSGVENGVSTLMEQSAYQYMAKNFYMYSRVSSETKTNAADAAKVIIKDNYGIGQGCAIANNGTLIIGNPKKALQVKKEWKDAEGDILSDHPDEVTVCLADKDGNKLSDDVTLNADNNWSYVWSDLDSVDNITVQEKAVDGYTAEITELSPESGFDWFPEDNFYVATIVNRPTTESETTRTKTLRVTKEWQDSYGNTIDAPENVESVTVHLLADGTPVDTNSGIDAEKTLNSENNWSAAWTDLDHSKSWTIEEDSVDGYTPSYTYGDNYLSTVNGSEVVSCEIKIVNKQKPSDQNKTQTLEVKKEWLDHDEHPLSEHPAQVTVRLLANGSEVSTDTVKDSVIVLNEGKNWDYIWKDLDDNTTWSVKEDAVDGYTSVVKTLVLSGDEAEAFASDTYYEITILNIKDEETPEPAIEETTAAPDPSEEEPETTAPETSATEPETTAPETSATEPETTEPETSATEPETTEPETSATVPETSAPETTRSSSGGGPSPKETTKSDDNPTEAPTESATEPVTESATVPETLPETQPSVSESVPEITQPEKPIYPELPEIPVTPDGEPDIPEGTEVEIFDLDDTSDPVYTGPYEEESLNLPPGDYEIVVIDDEGVPLAAGLFTIDEDGIPQSMGLPKTGDTSIPFVLLALLLAGSAAGMAVLMTRIRHMDE